MKTKREDLIWKRFNELAILWDFEVKKINWQWITFVLCKCNCGNIKYIRLSNVKTWNSKNCWCKRWWENNWRYTHWFCTNWIDRFYLIHNDMINRCNNPNYKQYKDYWWRWITYDKIWYKFENFRDDMYESYLEHEKKFWTKNTTIDRIDVNWNYCKGNCKWATRKEQNNNKRNALLVQKSVEVK